MTQSFMMESHITGCGVLCIIIYWIILSRTDTLECVRFDRAVVFPMYKAPYLYHFILQLISHVLLHSLRLALRIFMLYKF
jgi:hypothetical protein